VKNDNLWQGLNGVNNPCPSGYRLPTETEWNAELATWSQRNGVGAFASPLKLPAAGFRYAHDGSVNTIFTVGFYWSSTVNTVDTIPRHLEFGSNSYANVTAAGRGYGFSVRCLRD
jgi:uncharacterized protein (TIGR02145 family)